MRRAVFLSASVPDRRAKNYVADADTIAVSSAVKALVYVVLGRRQLVWGGHPAITPMIWSVASSMGVDYGSWVTLYQSRHFEDRYPEDNERFQNVIFTDELGESQGLTKEERRKPSLREMRERMFADNDIETAIFIGGMGGVVDEFKLFGEINPEARRFPILSTGGATTLLDGPLRTEEVDRERLLRDVDYVPLFHELCRIEFDEDREQFRPVG